MNAPLRARDFQNAKASLRYEPSGAVLGAYVDGVDLRDDLDPSIVGPISAKR
ncbi:MAG: hypothetical protein WDM79_03575 [Terricaulis sp.]